MIHDPISYRFFIHTFLPVLWQCKAGPLMIDHAFLFTKVVYSYLPKSCIPIYRNRVFPFTEIVYSYLPIMMYCYLPITTPQANELNSCKTIDYYIFFILGYTLGHTYSYFEEIDSHINCFFPKLSAGNYLQTRKRTFSRPNKNKKPYRPVRRIV